MATLKGGNNRRGQKIKSGFQSDAAQSLYLETALI
jgi:hypothetical protein